jgi:hypothetical protein
MSQQERNDAFVDAVLKDWAENTVSRFRRNLDRNHNQVTGALKASFQTRIIKTPGNQRAQIRFSDHGRYIDIQYYRLKRANKVAWTGGKRTKQKSSRWYSKNLWSSLPPLIDQLSRGYAEWAKDQIKSTFKNE